jgi:hypothetical protein
MLGEWIRNKPHSVLPRTASVGVSPVLGPEIFNPSLSVLSAAFSVAQLNLKQAQAVKFLTTIEEATGYDESLSTMYQLVQDSSLTDFFADKKTVATVFAPVDDVSRIDTSEQSHVSKYP